VPVTPAALVSAGVAWIAWRAHTLTSLGAAAAWIIGTLVLSSTGWTGGAVLAAFFISSNLDSRLGPRAPAPGLDAKGDRRDLWQVCANGGPAAIGAVIADDIHLGIWIVTASLAAAAADTWATSLGVRSEVPPRLLWSGRVVPAGTSGGVTLAGSGGALVGALIVSGTGALAARTPLLLPVGTLIGFAGMLVDSLIGGVMQGRFHCPVCRQASEWRVHRCGSRTVRSGGLAWLDNDAVNFLATAAAACAGAAAWHWLSSS
jgi:uncharacterized protein (TIGR00297 family)